MTRDQFILELRRALIQLPQVEVEDIIRDQNEYITEAIRAGRSESQVLKSLGDPKLLASSLQANIQIQLAEEAPSLNKQLSHTFGAILAILALAPLNIIFVLGPCLAILVFLICGWAGAMGLFALSIAFAGGFLLKLIFMTVGFWTQLSTFFLSLATVGSAILASIAMFWITRAIVTLIISYLKWNLNFIKTRS